LHHFQELARVGRQAFNIAALAFGIDRVEGERRLARSGQARHDNQPVPRQVQIDPLQIMFPRAAHGNDPGGVRGLYVGVNVMRHVILILSGGLGSPESLNKLVGRRLAVALSGDAPYLECSMAKANDGRQKNASTPDLS
jgi:hypothetical protein